MVQTKRIYRAAAHMAVNPTNDVSNSRALGAIPQRANEGVNLVRLS